MNAIEFNSNFNKLSNLLLAFAYNLTKNVEDARDLYQETAYRAITNQEKFAEGTNFKAWTFTIMKNIFINSYRKKVKQNTISDGTDNSFLIDSSTGGVQNLAETTIFMKELQTYIDKLDDSIRIPFTMHYHGYKYQEIAEHLDLPLGTIKSRIFFARKELKQTMEENYGGVVVR